MITMRIALAVASRLLRSRILIVAVLFGAVFIVLSASPVVTFKELKETGEMADAMDMKRMCMGAAIVIMGFTANLVALVLGSTVIRQDIQDGTIFSVLSKPVSRLQYFAGSMLGAGLCQCIVWVVFAILWFWFVYAADGSIQFLHIHILFSEVVKSLLILGLSFAWAQIFSPWVAATVALITFDGDYLVSTALKNLPYLHIVPTKEIVDTCTFPFPSFQAFDALAEQLGQTSIKPIVLFWQYLHMIDYCLAALLVAWLCFRKADLMSHN